MKSPKVSYEEKIIKSFYKKFTVASFTWNGQSFDGMTLARRTRKQVADHFLTELRAIRKDTLEAVEKGMSLNFGKGNFMDKEANKVDCRNCYIKAFNDYHRKLLSLISGMKGGKEI